MNKIKFLNKGFVFVVLLHILFSCAQQNQALSGGPMDSLPPYVKSSLPLLNDTNFYDKTIEIKFNEYLNPSSPIDQEFFSSPPFKEKPKFKISKKKLYIQLQEPLQDSVTYFFKFGSSVQDFHESNKIENFEFVFSTYNVIDSFRISGAVYDTWTHEPLNDVLVMFYSQNIDSLPLKTLPKYVTKVDSGGLFEIKHIKSGKYKIFALDDLNNNYTYDPDENFIAFCDTMVIPFCKNYNVYDTLDSGSVVKNKVDLNKLDTLLKDTIIVKNITDFYPNNLKLYFFTDQKNEQQIKRKYRESKGLVKISFVKPLINDYLKFFDFNMDTISYKIEKFQSKDSFYVWFTDKSFFDRDTIRFFAQYFSNDSTLKNDTVEFFDYNFTTDTIPLEMKTYKENISYSEIFALKSSNYLKSFDTNKIRIYQIVDTLVDDEKIQTASVIRPEFDSLIFSFSRPITKRFFIKFYDYSANDIPVIWSKNRNSDTFFCKIVTPSLHNIDTLKYILYYDNFYFYDQIQEFSDTFASAVTYQKLLSAKRPSLDTVQFEFLKDIPKNVDISLFDYDSNDFEYTILKNKIFVNIKSIEAIKTDTLDFLLRFFDAKLVDGSNKYFEDTIKVIYNFNKQGISYIRRYQRSKILMAFKKPLTNIPNIDLLSFRPDNKWYSSELNAQKDTLTINIFNQRVMRMLNMNFKISYFDINQHGDTLNIADTFNLKVEKLETENVKIIGREKKLTLLKPVSFRLKRDSVNIMNTNFESNYVSGKKYRVELDSLAFKDIYDKYNDTATFIFNVFAPEDYGSLTIDLKNSWVCLDSMNVDTSQFYSLPYGRLILQLEDKNGEIYKTAVFTSDIVLKDAMILPGTYNLRLFFDANSDGLWTSGNYLLHKQPEKVFIYKSSVTISKGAKETIIWDLNE